MNDAAIGDDGSHKDGLRTWAGFLVMCLGMFMAILDIQIVATSLPTIQQALGITPDRMVWVQTAYLTAEIVAIPLTGYLTGLLGMRWLFVSGVTLFTIASAGCALSQSFEALIAWRIIQGFAGGTLIPSVFAAVFLLFPQRSQGPATTVAGVAAVLAPTIGPIVGGWITQTWSWHFLFAINIVPGVVAAVAAAALLRIERINQRAPRALDLVALIAMGLALAALEIGLKDAPERGWSDPRVVSWLALSVFSGAFFIGKSLRASRPLVELNCFRDRNFTIGCALSFVLGVGLFGSTYLMPVFLGLVRGHGALRIGEIMLATGVAQLIAAPIAVFLERRADARLLTAIGFVMFGVGAWLSTQQTIATDAADMIAPQILRGAAIMLCLLPPTRLALGRLPAHLVADGSGLFNLMRNMGGAVGLALIDTVIFSRSATHAARIAGKLASGDVDTAVAIGVPREMLLGGLPSPMGEMGAGLIKPLIEKAALTEAINESWLLISVSAAIAVALLALVRRQPQEAPPSAPMSAH